MAEDNVIRKRLEPRKHSKYPQLFVVRFQNGGQVPEELTGTYVSEGQAYKAIDQYLFKKNRTNATSQSK